MDEQVEKSMNSKEKGLLELYRELHFGQNPVCHKCRKERPALSRPIGAWLIGNEFYTHNTRVLFVGKMPEGNWMNQTKIFRLHFRFRESCGTDRGHIGATRGRLLKSCTAMTVSKTLHLQI